MVKCNSVDYYVTSSPLAGFSVLVLVLYLDAHLSNYVLIFMLCVSRVAVCIDSQ
jgi:hypothetical protein